MHLDCVIAHQPTRSFVNIELYLENSLFLIQRFHNFVFVINCFLYNKNIYTIDVYGGTIFESIIYMVSDSLRCVLKKFV